MSIVPGNLVKLNIDNVSTVAYKDISDSVGLVIREVQLYSEYKDFVYVDWIGNDKFKFIRKDSLIKIA